MVIYDNWRAGVVFLGPDNSFDIVKGPPTLGGRILLASVAVGLFIYGDFQNAGPRSAHAFELPLETKTKDDRSSLKTSLNGQARDAVGWLSFKFDSNVWKLNPAGSAYDLVTVPGADQTPTRSTMTDTSVTLGMWDDWVHWTSRQAVSNYVAPGTGLGYLVRPGFEFDDVATSQHFDATVWKTETMWLALYGEYARVGANFEVPTAPQIIKRDDPFATPNSSTTRLGGSFGWKTITFNFEQRTQQSLAEDNAPVKVENKIGVSLSLDELRTNKTGWIPQSVSWALPSSAYLYYGRGKVRAPVDQWVNGDTISDVSAGLSWNVKNFYATAGYWWSNYQSPLYPWKGSGLDGSLGFYVDQWAFDLYFDVYLSSSGSPQQWVDGLPTQQLIPQKYNEIDSGFRFTTHF